MIWWRFYPCFGSWIHLSVLIGRLVHSCSSNNSSPVISPSSILCTDPSLFYPVINIKHFNILFFLHPFRIASCPLVLVAVGTLLWLREPRWVRASRMARTGTDTDSHTDTRQTHVRHTYSHNIKKKNRYFQKDMGKYGHIHSFSCTLFPSSLAPQVEAALLSH